MAGDTLARKMVLGLPKRGKMGLVPLPMGWSGAQLLACEVSDALMSLWDTCLSLPDE